MDELKLLRRAGLSQVAQGADRGSPKVLNLMNKEFQKVETIHAAAAKLSQAGIRPRFNIIFGFPGEGRAERRESIQLVMQICRSTRAPNFGPISSRRILGRPSCSAPSSSASKSPKH